MTTENQKQTRSENMRRYWASVSPEQLAIHKEKRRQGVIAYHKRIRNPDRQETEVVPTSQTGGPTCQLN